MSEPQKSVVWIASYPKSGNTWARFLTCNLVYGPQNTAAALNQLAPDVHELGPNLSPPSGPVLLKTHFPYGPALPLAAHTAAAIYVVRHPADVMLSNYHYAQRSGAEDAAASLDRFVVEYLQAGGDPRWIRLGMGGWADNVASWTQSPLPFPVLLLRYEDLAADAAEGARRICGFLGLDRSAEAIGAAVEAASFERMRAIEEADIQFERVGIFFKPYLRRSIASGLRFMRSGEIGQGNQRLSSLQRDEFLATFGQSMQGLGYR